MALPAKALASPIPSSRPEPHPTRFALACDNPSEYPADARLIRELHRHLIKEAGQYLDPAPSAFSCEELLQQVNRARSLRLDFESTQGEPVDFSLLAEATTLDYLELLHVRPADVSTIPPIPSLDSVRIIGAKSTDGVSPAIIKFIADQTYISYLTLIDLGIEDLSPLKKMEAMGEVNLSGNRITDTDLESIQRVCIWHLDLSNNPITQFNSVPKCPEMRSLNLKKTGITSVGDLSEYADLAELDLRETPFAESKDRLDFLWNNSLIEILNEWSPYIEACQDLKNRPESYEVVRTIHWWDTEVDSLPGFLRYTAPEPDECLTSARRVARSTLMELKFERLDRTPNSLAALAGFKRLESLRLIDHKADDFTPLAGLKRLRTLEANQERSGTDGPNFIPVLRSGIAPLKDLKLLEYVSLRGCGISDLSPLDGHRNIKSLDLSENNIPGTELVYLKDLSELQSLDLSKNPLITLNFLPPLPSLEQFKANSSLLNDIRGLESAPSLTEVELNENKITSIDELRSKENLNTLKIAENRISELSPLSTSQKLQSVIASGNLIRDLRDFTNSGSLQELNLAYNQFDDIQGIEKLSSLQSLDLSGNAIRNIQLLTNLFNLTILKLNQCRIRNMSVISSLSQLTDLELSRNSIEKTEELNGFMGLRKLDLSNNFIRNIQPVTRLISLTSLNLKKNRISEIPASFSKLENLYELNLAENQLQDISILGKIRNWESLNLSRNLIRELPDLSLTSRMSLLAAESNQIVDLSPLAHLHVDQLKLANNRITDIRPLQGIFSENILRTTNVNDTYFLKTELQGNPIRDFSPLVENLPRKPGLATGSETRATDRYLHNEWLRNFTHVTISQGHLTDSEVQTLRAKSPFDFLTVLP